MHRAIKHLIRGKKSASYRYDDEQMAELGLHCSTTERRADDATRDATAWLKCEYMLDKVGESFEGLISSVTGFGLFVELDDIHVEGLVHITALHDDYYQFDSIKHRMTGEHSGKVYRLGDKVLVKVAAVSLDERKIDFTIEALKKQATKRKKKNRRKRRWTK